MSEAEALQNAVRGQYAAGTVLGKLAQRLSRRARCRPRLDDRDIHCLPAERRQLALGWRAILFAHWQTACSAPGDTLCWVGAKIKR
jgi:hypothetical protein